MGGFCKWTVTFSPVHKCQNHHIKQLFFFRGNTAYSDIHHVKLQKISSGVVVRGEGGAW